MFDKMKQLMEMKKQADALKRELEAASIESNDVHGIKIVINGAQQFKSIVVDESLLNAENKSRLESELLRGMNAAIKKSQDLAAQKMRHMMPGLPGM